MDLEKTFADFVKLRTQRPEDADNVGTTKNNHEARLRLDAAEISALCSSSNLTAASPLGSRVRPVSISLTDDGESPTRAPMAANVISFLERRSLMHEAQRVGGTDSVVITPSLRHAVDLSQRLPVTVFRDNMTMPKPVDMPTNLDTIGARVAWWRKHRKISRSRFAKDVGYSYSGLADLESSRSGASEKLHLIAAVLKLNPHYLQYNKGEPEAEYPQEPPPSGDEWPFPAIPRSKLKKLNKIERGYLETELLKVLMDIEAERRNKSG
jgi:transcriptional regulator with XRE-family HTH domain